MRFLKIQYKCSENAAQQTTGATPCELGRFTYVCINTTLIFTYTTVVNNKKYAVGVIYRHPDPNFKTFSEKLFSILHELNDKKYIYFVRGDFNI